MTNPSQAPVAAAADTEIAAPVEIVWDTLTDVERWPDWNSAVRKVAVSGAIAPGSVFRWKSGPGTITSTIRRVEPPWKIEWTGRTFGIDALHVWHLEDGGGTTKVHTEEAFGGALASVFRRPLARKLSTALVGGLADLKAEAERRAGR